MCILVMFILLAYNLFSCPSVDLPVGTMGVSELFFLKQPSWFCNISSLTVNQFI